MREKLIELLDEATDKLKGLCGGYNDGTGNSVRADHLIANGVTFATDTNDGDKMTPTAEREAKLYWKPVEKGVWNLTCSWCDSHLGCKENAKYCPECGAKFVKAEALCHELPEGE